MPKLTMWTIGAGPVAVAVDVISTMIEYPLRLIESRSNVGWDVLAAVNVLLWVLFAMSVSVI